MSVHISVEAEVLNPDSLRKILETEGCGSIVSFIGITRESEGNSMVERLEFDHWDKELPIALEKIGRNAVSEFDINSVVIAHRTGVAGFAACSWIMDELKSQAPLWKKEVTTEGESWKSGLG